MPPAKSFMPLPYLIVQVTAAYSNAVLVAIMPHISDFAEKLDLPIPQPVNAGQVSQFNCSPRTDLIGGRVVLTNGCEFTFLHGHVESYSSPKSYYELQNPKLIPKLFGKASLSETQSVELARSAVKKLGYTDTDLFIDGKPVVKTPPKFGTNSVPHYLVRWLDPSYGSGGPKNLPTSVEMEVNAATRQIEMVNLSSPNIIQPDPEINIHPPVMGESPKTVYLGGHKINPVTPEYAKAFLAAVLPQLTSFVIKGNIAAKKPILAGDVDMARYLTKYSCGVVDADMMATIDLKDGTQFTYRHGQVIAFYSDTAMERPDRDWPQSFTEQQKFRKKFYGVINLTTNDAVRLVRETIRGLGYPETMLPLNDKPEINEPGWWGTNRIARCYIIWYGRDDGELVRTTRVSAEVDMTTKTLKSLYINDHANTNIWRKPPDVGIPLPTTPTAENQKPPATTTPSEEPNPPVSKPPGI
jgi:hypothetical protein